MAQNNDLTVRVRLIDELSQPIKRGRQEVAAFSAEVQRSGDKTDKAAGSTKRLSGAADEVAPAMRKASTETRSAGDSAEASARKFQGMSSSFSALKAFTAGVAASVTATTGYLGKLGIGTAANQEQMEISFTTLLKSNQKAKAEMAWLTETAKATPFELGDLTRADQTLLGFGFTADSVRRDYLKMAGDIASASGIASSGVPEIARILGQVKAAGKMNAEDLNQLIDRGIPILDILSKSTGKTVGQLRKMSEQGELTWDVLDKAWRRAATTDYAGAMDAQSKTFLGRLSTFKDSVSLTMADMFKPYLPAMGEYLELAGQKFAEFGQKVPGMIEALKAKFAELSGGDLGQTVRALAGDLGGTLEQLTAQMGQVDWTALVSGGLRGLSETLANLSPLLRLGAAGVKLLSDNSDKLASAIPTLLAALALWKSGQLVNNAIGRNSVIGFYAQIGSTIALTLANRQLAASMGQVAAATATATGAESVSMFTRIRAVAATVASTVASGAMRLATMASTAAQWALNVALSANPIGLVVVAIAALVAGLVWFFTKTELGQQIWGAFTAKLVEGWNWVTEKVSDGVGWIVQKWNEMWAFGEKLGEGIGKIVGKIAGFFSDLPGTIGNALRGFGTMIWNMLAVPAINALNAVIRAANNIPGVSLGEISTDSPFAVAPDMSFADYTSTRRGDTMLARGRGGGIMNTLAQYRAISAQAAGATSISNMFIGGGGTGYGSGDHQSGRALDLVGSMSSLMRIRDITNARGGYAAIHGTGPNTHLHFVAPTGGMIAGDTVTSRVRSGLAPVGAPVYNIALTVNSTEAVDVDTIKRIAIEGIRRADAELYERS